MSKIAVRVGLAVAVVAVFVFRVLFYSPMRAPYTLGGPAVAVTPSP